MVAVAIATDLDIRPISPVIGAEVHGLDLSSRWAKRGSSDPGRPGPPSGSVLPDQDLSPEVQTAFARQFGEVTPAHPVIDSLEGHPEVLPIDGREDRASWWHTDVTFLATPPLGSILHMREAPAVGGDTMWVSLQAAYDALAEPLRRFCDGLIAWHHDPWFAADVEANGGYEWDGKRHAKLLPTSHPVVRTHPETGRNGLFVNSQFTRFLEGFSPLESTACSTCSTATASAPNSGAASAGRWGRWPSGTTGPPSTTPSTTTATRCGCPPGDPARPPPLRPGPARSPRTEPSRRHRARPHRRHTAPRTRLAQVTKRSR